MSIEFVTELAVERVALTGFMGSGKTTVGRLLAQRLGWDFLDLDHEIVRRDGRTVAAIFAQDGEAAFRKMETDALTALLKKKRIVLALGGGTPEQMSNQLLLQQAPQTAVVHLTAPFTVLVERCKAEDGMKSRPVLADLAKAEERFHLRSSVYRELATHTIETSEMDAAAIVDEIVRHLKMT